MKTPEKTRQPKPKTTVITVRLTELELSSLQKVSKKLSQPISESVRQALSSFGQKYLTK